jgi:hypothetical protein
MAAARRYERRAQLAAPAPVRDANGERVLVEAMRYLAQSDPVKNRSAIEMLSEHVRTRFPLDPDW